MPNNGASLLQINRDVAELIVLGSLTGMIIMSDLGEKVS